MKWNLIFNAQGIYLPPLGIAIIAITNCFICSFNSPQHCRTVLEPFSTVPISLALVSAAGLASLGNGAVIPEKVLLVPCPEPTASSSHQAPVFWENLSVISDSPPSAQSRFQRLLIFLLLFQTEELYFNSLSLYRNNLKSLSLPSSFLLALPVLSVPSQWLRRNVWNRKDVGKPHRGKGVKNGFVFPYLFLPWVFILLFAFWITAANKAGFGGLHVIIPTSPSWTVTANLHPDIWHVMVELLFTHMLHFTFI